MLSTRRSPLAVVFALVAAVACVLGWPAAALAAEAMARQAASPERGAGPPSEPSDRGPSEPGPSEPGLAAGPADVAASWEPVASSCDADAPAPLPPEPMCEIIAVDPDEDGFFAAAPLCDPSGASVVAAEPIHPIGDDRIEATPSCDGDDDSSMRLDRRNGPDDPAQRIQVALDPALLPTLPAVPRFWSAASDVGPSRLLGPAEGVRPRLEHPPHGA